MHNQLETLPDEAPDNETPTNDLCLHGKPINQCNPCDYAAQLSFDGN
jgi:hypothetical protein